MPLSNQHGPAHLATTDAGLIARVGATLEANGAEPGEVFLTPDGDLADLWEVFCGAATFTHAAHARLVDGAPGRCHENVAERVAEDPAIEWWFGYALSDDGMWRTHSWGFDPRNGEILETTVEREGYVGFPLDPAQRRHLAGDAPAPGDFVKLHLALDGDEGPGGEQLWAEWLGEERYRIANVPFFASSLCLGSVVEAARGEVTRVLSHAYGAWGCLALDPAVDPRPLLEALDGEGVAVECAVRGMYVAAVPAAAEDAFASLCAAAGAKADILPLPAAST